MKTLLVFLILVLLALPAGFLLAQDSLDANAAPTLATFMLASPLTLDPYIITATGGGPLESSALNIGTDCRGYVTSNPTVNLNLSTASAPLSLYFNSASDSTLLIRTPSGSFICSDDSPGSLNPLVTIPRPTSGVYNVWVGMFSPATAPGYLLISETGLTSSSLLLPSMTTTQEMVQPPASTEMPSTSASTEMPMTTTAGALNPDLEANFGSTALATGFTDPFSVAVISGGFSDAAESNVDMGASLGGDCRGYATDSPDFSLNWSGTGSPLRIFYVGDGDTTLIVRTPTGQFLCNDDYSGLNPLVDIPNPGAGEYDIWVGSYTQAENIEGTLYITSQTTLDPSNAE